MKCTKCHSVSPEGSKFCQYCGRGLVGSLLGDEIKEPLPDNETTVEITREEIVNNESVAAETATEKTDDSIITEVLTEKQVVISDTKTDKKRKKRFCKLCGGELVENKKCTQCGKQYFSFRWCWKKKTQSKSTIAIVILSIVSVGAISWNFLPFGICSTCKQFAYLDEECTFCQSSICSECDSKVQQKSLKRYDEGYDAGYDKGFDDGYDAGKAAKVPDDSSFNSIREEYKLRKLYYNN